MYYFVSVCALRTMDRKSWHLDTQGEIILSAQNFTHANALQALRTTPLAPPLELAPQREDAEPIPVESLPPGRVQEGPCTAPGPADEVKGGSTRAGELQLAKLGHTNVDKLQPGKLDSTKDGHLPSSVQVYSVAGEGGALQRRKIQNHNDSTTHIQ